MNWQEIQKRLLDDGKADLCLMMFNQFSCTAQMEPDHCEFEESGEWLVGTTPKGRKLFWDKTLGIWLCPAQAAHDSAMQKKKVVEKRLGIMGVLCLDYGSMATASDLRTLLLNVSPLMVTRARKLISSELGGDGRPEFEWVGLVTVEVLTTLGIREWESSQEAIVAEMEELRALGIQAVR